MLLKKPIKNVKCNLPLLMRMHIEIQVNDRKQIVQYLICVCFAQVNLINEFHNPQNLHIKKGLSTNIDYLNLHTNYNMH